jgi:hypothetical protein
VDERLPEDNDEEEAAPEEGGATCATEADAAGP